MKILILGASGMIGLAILKQLAKNKIFLVFGTTTNQRSKKILENINNEVSIHIYDFLKEIDHTKFINMVQPQIIINCVGIIKQSPNLTNTLHTIQLNSLLPQQLSLICKDLKIKLIHISTDCVFSGIRGNYKESDNPDPLDLYGRTKLIGETINSNDLTLRTSLVGHEILTQNGLLEWFLSQKDYCKGYKNAYFSGFTTVEFAKIIEKIILHQTHLSGLYHIASKIISKYDFLNKVKKIYKDIKIIEDN